jgi:DNA processing protein
VSEHGHDAGRAPASAPALALWLRFLRVPGIGARRRLELLNHFGSLEALFESARGQLARLLADAPQALAALRAEPDEKQLATDLAWFNEPRRQLLTWFDEDYPRLLREIPDPPVALFVIGERAVLSLPQLAVVGSRNATAAGRENARAFAHELAQAGLVITSGMALGVDAAAHRGALESGAATIAVMGTGLDRVYPARHRELAHAIAQQGALLSEFPLGTAPRPENFPIRNRIVSGLALGVLVVEAAERSGALITARLGSEQGREVFAIPGSIHSPLSRGCHRLIRQGAKLVETARDVLEELGPLASVVTPAGERPSVLVSPAPDALPEPAQQLLACLGYDAMTVDALVERSGLTADTVSSMLLVLELHGFVASGPGGNYQRLT